jgi:outer membrane protein with beta-barrel domain
MGRAAWFGLLVASLASLSMPASAADTNVGIVGGGLFNSMPALSGSLLVPDFNNQTENGRDFGALGGVIIEHSWPTFGALRFEPKYMRKGTILSTIQNSGNYVKGDVELDYVSLPLLFKSTMFRSKPVQLVLISGLSADYLLKARFLGEDIKNEFESWDFTVTARIGFQVKAGANGVFGVQFNVASSLAGIDKGQPGQEKLKNTGLGFAVEYTHTVAHSK